MPTILYDVLYSIRKNSGLSGCARPSEVGRGKRRKLVIDEFPAHMLRHTYATMLFDADVDVKSAQKFLGHADI